MAHKPYKPTLEELEKTLEFYEGVFGYSPSGSEEQEQRDNEVVAVNAIEYLRDMMFEQEKKESEPNVSTK